MTKNIAIILAGGSGVRVGYKTPKQFLKVAGKLVIEHTISTFQNHKDIDEIAIVCHKNYTQLAEDIVNNNGFDKVKKVLNGGKERCDSSFCAINSYAELLDANLLFHDASRPLVSDKIISDCVAALKIHNAVDVAISATDTIIKTAGDFIENIPDRSKLMQGQTPQAFKCSVIKKAYEIGMKDKNFQATDDCGVVKTYLPDEKIYVVCGNTTNMKLTSIDDLFLLDKLFQGQSRQLFQPFNDFAVLKDKVLVVFGAGYGIGSDIVAIAESYGCKVYGFSRTQNNTDISKKSDVKDALEKVYAQENSIDYIVNTAGILHKEPLINMDYADIEQAVAVNYLGCIIIAKESFKYLAKSGGSLLFFVSSSYTRGRSNYSIYSSSKAAIVNFTQAIATEWNYAGIFVNCINPERTNTPMRVKNFGVEDEKTLLKSIDVATVSIEALLLKISGQVINININDG